MDNSSKMVIVGGFLGAGKTTSILSLAKKYLANGKKVGIVTNDQGSELVDENYLRSIGMDVLSVEGGCFCCNFNNFTSQATRFNADVVLCEPVGSCTDLIATLFKPLLTPTLSRFPFNLAPLSMVVDPKRLLRFIRDIRNSQEMTPLNYLFEKQLEEANLIVLNKCDLLTKNEIGYARAFLAERFPGIGVICVSALDESGMDEWLTFLGEPFDPKQLSLSIDYDIYAKAEAMLGWLNASCTIKFAVNTDVNRLVRLYIARVAERLAFENAEIAHIKCYAVAQDDFYKASMAGCDGITVDHAMVSFQNMFNFVINARVRLDPSRLRVVCEETIYEIFEGVSNLNIQCFEPSRPEPTYRQ